MKSLFIFFLLSIFFLKNSLASTQGLRDEKQNLSDLCENPEPAIKDAVRIEDKAEFFFRSFPLSDRLTYSANQKNYILDFKKRLISKAPGTYDGFPTPDERYLITANGTDGTKFFDMKNLKTPVLVDHSHTGYYQSCGAYKNSAGQSVYRVMIDDEKKGFSFKEYSVDKNSKLKAIREEPTPLCANLKNISLPMLSKDGKMLAAFDAVTQATNIYKIDSRTGNCSEPKSLGINAGKVDFSFDNKSVTYSQVAVLSAEHIKGDRTIWMRAPKGDMVANIYIQNLKTGETRALTHYTNSNALYPSFNSKGEIIARKFDKSGTEFIKLDPNAKDNKSAKAQIPAIASCTSLPKDLLAALKLGAIFLNYCDEKHSIWNADSILLLGRDLDSKKCHLLMSRWSKESNLKDLDFLKGPLSKTKLNMNLIKEISISDLSAACGG